jgi:hypothetical protein
MTATSKRATRTSFEPSVLSERAANSALRAGTDTSLGLNRYGESGFKVFRSGSACSATAAGFSGSTVDVVVLLSDVAVVSVPIVVSLSGVGAVVVVVASSVAAAFCRLASPSPVSSSPRLRLFDAFLALGCSSATG